MKIKIEKNNGIELDSIFEYLSNTLFNLHISYVESGKHFTESDFLEPYVTKISDTIFTLNCIKKEREDDKTFRNTLLIINLEESEYHYELSFNLSLYVDWILRDEFRKDFEELAEKCEKILLRDINLDKIID